MKTIMPLFEDLVKETCGSSCIKLIKIMEVKDNISEFDLAEKMKINVNEMRTLLYKLSEKNLVLSTRKKDKEKGWYIYYWSFNFRHAKDLLIKRKEQQLEELKKRLDPNVQPKYICENGCSSYNIEDAMELNFKCPECNFLLKLKEVKYNPEIVNKKIAEVEGHLDLLQKSVIIERIPVEKEKTVKKIKKKTKKVSKKIKSKKVAKKKIQKIAKKPPKKPPKKKSRPSPKKNPKRKSHGILKKLRKIKF